MAVGNVWKRKILGRMLALWIFPASGMPASSLQGIRRLIEWPRVLEVEASVISTDEPASPKELARLRAWSAHVPGGDTLAGRLSLEAALRRWEQGWTEKTELRFASAPDGRFWVGVKRDGTYPRVAGYDGQCYRLWIELPPGEDDRGLAHFLSPEEAAWGVVGLLDRPETTMMRPVLAPFRLGPDALRRVRKAGRIESLRRRGGRLVLSLSFGQGKSYEPICGYPVQRLRLEIEQGPKHAVVREIRCLDRAGRERLVIVVTKTGRIGGRRAPTNWTVKYIAWEGGTRSCYSEDVVAVRKIRQRGHFDMGPLSVVPWGYRVYDHRMKQADWTTLSDICPGIEEALPAAARLAKRTLVADEALRNDQAAVRLSFSVLLRQELPRFRTLEAGHFKAMKDSDGQRLVRLAQAAGGHGGATTARTRLQVYELISIAERGSARAPRARLRSAFLEALSGLYVFTGQMDRAERCAARAGALAAASLEPTQAAEVWARLAGLNEALRQRLGECLRIEPSILGGFDRARRLADAAMRAGYPVTAQWFWRACAALAAAPSDRMKAYSQEATCLAARAYLAASRVPPPYEQGRRGLVANEHPRASERPSAGRETEALARPSPEMAIWRRLTAYERGQAQAVVLLREALKRVRLARSLGNAGAAEAGLKTMENRLSFLLAPYIHYYTATGLLRPISLGAE